MRQFIQIVTEKLNHASIIQMVDAMDGDPIDQDALAECIDRAQEIALRNPLTVYRVMGLSASDVASLRPGARLGRHWAMMPDFDTSNLYGSHANVMFVGEVRGAGVDVEATAAHLYAFPDEHEVVFAGEAVPVTIMRIYSFATKEPVREDLWGQKFWIS